MLYDIMVIKTQLLATGLVFFVRENPNDLCARLRLKLQEKECGTDKNRKD